MPLGALCPHAGDVTFSSSPRLQLARASLGLWSFAIQLLPKIRSQSWVGSERKGALWIGTSGAGPQEMPTRDPSQAAPGSRSQEVLEGAAVGRGGEEACGGPGGLSSPLEEGVQAAPGDRAHCGSFGAALKCATVLLLLGFAGPAVQLPASLTARPSSHQTPATGLRTLPPQAQSSPRLSVH